MKIYSAKLSDPGMSGKNNEDNCVISSFSRDNGNDAYFAVVADGIGGHNAGELASKIAVDTAQAEFSAADLADPRAAFRRIILDVNQAIFERAQSNPQFNGMGTTLALAVVANGELHAAGIGDSRVYLLPQDRNPVQVTIDHTWAQEAIDAKRLKPEEARRHPNRNVLKRYLGILPDVEVDDKVLHKPQPFKEGDAVVICSDGLTDLVSADEIQQIVKGNNPETAAAQLVKTANDRGGHDNITTIVLKTTPGNGVLPAIIPAAQQSNAGQPILIVILVLLVLVVFGLLGYVLLNQQSAFGGQQVIADTPSVTPPPTELPTAPATLTTAPSNTAAPIVVGNATSTLVYTSTPVPTNTDTLTFTPTRTRTFTPTPTSTPTDVPITDTPSPTMRERQGGGNNNNGGNNNDGNNNDGGNDNGGEPKPPSPCTVDPTDPTMGECK